MCTPLMQGFEHLLCSFDVNIMHVIKSVAFMDASALALLLILSHSCDPKHSMDLAC